MQLKLMLNDEKVFACIYKGKNLIVVQERFCSCHVFKGLQDEDK